MVKPHRDSTVDNLGQSLLRGFALLEELSRRGPSQLGQIATALSLPKSTVHRLLHLLQQQGYVAQDPESRAYRLTLKLFEVGYRVVAATGLREKALPLMEQLSSQTGETVLLSALDGIDVVYVEKIESLAAVRLTSPIGSRVPLHATAAGKAILSGYWPDSWRSLLAASTKEDGSLPRLTDATIIDLESLDEELAKVRRHGYAVDDGESMTRVRAVAAPIRDFRGRTVAAISVAGPDFRLPDDQLSGIAQAVMEVAKEIELATSGDLSARSSIA